MTHEHLSDEQLSAHLDGEAYEAGSAIAASEETVENQIAGCDRCRHRLGALAEASALVRVPVASVSPSVRAAAVEAALTEAAEGGPGVASTAGLTTLRSSSPPRPTGVLVGAAAAVVVLIVGVGLALGLSHKGSPASTSAVAAAGSHARGTPEEPRVPATLAPAGLADLGSVGTPASLRSRVTALLASKSSDQESVPMGSGSPSTMGAPSSSSAGIGTTPSASSATNGAASMPTFGTEGCVAAAQKSVDQNPGLSPSAGPFTVVATVTYRGTPALVLVQRSTTAPLASGHAVVVTRTGCRVLASTTL
jgi:serine/threonine-protein kinase